MKKTTAAGIAAGVLALAGAGGILFSTLAEQAIRSRIETLPGYEEARCDGVRVSLPLRTVRISNLRLRGPEGEFACREAVLRPRLAAMLAAVPPLRSAALPSSGPVIVGDADLRDMTARIASPDNRPPVDVSLDSLAVYDGYLDTALFTDLLDGRPVAAQDFSGKAGSARIDGTGIGLRQSRPSFRGTLESFRLRDGVFNTSAALCEIGRFSLAGTEGDFSGSLLRLTDIAVPPALAACLRASAAPSPEALRQALESAGPLFRTMLLEDGGIAVNGEKAEIRRLRVDWHSSSPPHTVTHLERLRLPASLLYNNGLPPLPGLDQLLVNLDWEHRRRGDLRQEDIALDVTDMGRMDAALEHTLDPRLFSGAMTALIGTQLHTASLRYEDRGGLARLLALFFRGRNTPSQVDLLASRLPAVLPGQANRPLVEALRATLLTPGILELRLRDGMALTALDMLDIRNLGRKIEASATAGKEHVADQIRRLPPP